MSSLAERSATYLVGGVLAQGTIFVTWFSLSWLLSPVELGLLSLVLFAIELLTVVSSVGMDAALIRFATREQDSAAAFSIALRIILSGFSLAIAATFFVVFIYGPIVTNQVMLWISEHFLLLAVGAAANVSWNIYQSVQIAGRNARQYASFQIVRSMVYFFLCIGLVLIRPAAASVIVATAVASFFVLLVLPRYNSIKMVTVPNNGDTLMQKTMLYYGFPLMLYGLVGLATTYTQRLAVDHYTNAKILGVFAFFNVITLQLNGLWGSVNKSWTPEFFFLLKEHKTDALAILQGILVIISVMCPLGLAIYVIVGELFLNSLIFSAEYLEHVQILYILLVGTFFTGLYTVAYPLYYAEHQTKRILVISICLSLCNLAVSVLMVGRLGAMGAAASVALMSIITLWAYLLVYRDWADADHRSATMLLLVTMACMGSVLTLIWSGSPWLFVTGLMLTAALAWVLGASLARPVLRRLFM
jgi:O-antigen/teichoic acid export membrane protein